MQWLPLLLALFSTASAFSQEPPAPAEGIVPVWGVNADMQSLAEDVRRLLPLLARVTPQAWTAKGAPDAYVQQWQSGQQAVRVLIASTGQLAQNPEKLPAALEALFCMDSVDALLGSLVEGIRKYQSPTLASEFTTQLASHGNHRERLRRHSLDLSATQEEALAIMHAEAQRCRDQMVQSTPGGGKARRSGPR